ncbi:intermembrane space aaa protease iap-1 [Diplodia corticola]|uniref:Intermembrane space aaa protease iap-1 n=1 Tax=Diplodia corticola TaxID=236234 RepID=A0A1J9SLC0_9PEZI|nr:intermembrane space aaa protease iap-1 [Diplodia corticola]OJD40413.1 intermembrane space aaa protease iap-1 [Diplodia corticola]
MAFHAPVSLQGIASAATGTWPSISAVAPAPWRLVGRRASPSESATLRDGSKAHKANAVVPECLASVPLSALRPRPSPEALGAPQTVAGMFSQGNCTVPAHTLRRFSPLSRAFPSVSTTSRQYSTLTRLAPFKLNPVPRPGNVGLTQQRSIFGGNTSRNLLAHMEQTANNNPGSASAQNAFYAALLRANLPQIVVERYESGRFATNAACDALYTRGLERLGQSDKAPGLQGNNGTAGQSSGLGMDQISAIGQAVGARVRGGNVATARSGSGERASPLYVVVEESTGSTIFKWVKFFLWFGLLTYLSMVCVTMVIEASGMLQRRGAKQDMEAKPELQTTRFSDVHGCEEAKEELQELVDFLKAPDKFNALGGKLPKGVLLVGPPGTGKTLLARAVAGEAGVPFFYMSGSEFDEVYVGVGAKRVRELFDAAKSKAPAIVFVDELDAIGGKRNDRDHAYVKQTLNQLLTELDGFEQNSGVIFIAATNFPELLDKALTRPGRFDRNVTVPLPDVRGRSSILKHHMRNVQIGTDVDADVIARGTPGFSGAELENIVNQAAVHASKNKQKRVSMIDFEWAKDKVLLGAERRSAVIQQKDKIATAYHEGGHALVAMFTKHSDPLYKATIMPRGHALGITFQLPEMDRVSQTKLEYLAHIDVCMGGKVAEELIYGPDYVTSGGSSDIQKATAIAYSMVTQMGMSDELGNIDLYSNFSRLSSETKNKIEDEVRKILDASRERAKKLLTEKRQELDRLAGALVEYESLSKEEMEKAVRGEKIDNKLKGEFQLPIKLPESLMPPALPGSGDQSGNSPAPGSGIPGANGMNER